MTKNSRDRNREWEKIVADAFSPTAPQHVFSPSYLRRKTEMIENALSNNPRRFSPLRLILIAAAILLTLAVLFVGAGTAVRNLSMNTAPSEQTPVELQPAASPDANAPYASLSYGWLPSGSPETDDNGSISYQSDAYGYTVRLYALTDETQSPSDLWADGEADDNPSDTVTTDDRTIYVYRDRFVYCDSLWVFFTDTSYAALVETYGISDTDEETIVENLALTPSTKSKSIAASPHSVTRTRPAINETALNTLTTGKQWTTDNPNITITVQSITAQDDFTGIDTGTDGSAHDYSRYLSDDGTVCDECTLDDGTAETVPQTILRLTLSLTNSGKADAEVPLHSRLFVLTDNSLSSPDDGKTYDLTDKLRCDDSYFSLTSNADTEEGTVIVPSGETVTCTLSFLVDTDRLSSCYLDLSYDGIGSFSPDDTVLSLSDLLDTP